MDEQQNKSRRQSHITSAPDENKENISNSNIWKENDKQSQKEVESMFSEMIGWAVDEGADMLIGETFYYAEEAFKALEVMKKANLPTVLTISPMGENVMRDGKSVVDTCKELEQKGADVVGLNCFRGPATMFPFLKDSGLNFLITEE